MDHLVVNRANTKPVIVSSAGSTGRARGCADRAGIRYAYAGAVSGAAAVAVRWLRGVDLLLHAGDIGELWVLDRLSVIAPVLAVHGNDDTADAKRELPYQQVLMVAGQRIVLTHAHYSDRAQELELRKDDAWGPKLERRAAFGRRAGASIVVFGHTHVPMALQHGEVCW